MTSKSALDNVKLLISGSPYFIDKECAKVADNLHDAEILKYGADEIPDDFFPNLFSKSLFYGRKVAFIHRIESLKNLNGFFDKICRANDVSIVVTISAARKDDERKKTEALEKKIKTAKELAERSGFRVLSESVRKGQSVADEIAGIFSAYGLTVNTKSAEQIWDMLECDLLRVDQEAKKLSLYYEAKRHPSQQELLSYVSNQSRGDVFSFINSFMDKHPDECLKNISQMREVDRNAPVIFEMLRSFFAGLYFKIKVPTLNSPKNPLFFKKSMYFMGTVNKVFGYWKAEEVEIMVSYMVHIDIGVKTGRVEKSDILPLMIKQLAEFSRKAYVNA